MIWSLILIVYMDESYVVIVECRTKKLQFGEKLDWCLEKFEGRPRAEIKLFCRIQHHS